MVKSHENGYSIALPNQVNLNLCRIGHKLFSFCIEVFCNSGNNGVLLIKIFYIADIFHRFLSIDILS